MAGMFQVIPRMVELSLVKNVIKLKGRFAVILCYSLTMVTKERTKKYTEIKNISLVLWFKQVLGMKNARIS